MEFDALILSRLQFAFTIAYHIMFPALTIGLACYLAVLEGLWLKTRDPVFRSLYLFWIKIFALSFGMGVVTGVVMSYQFGTNWSEFIHRTGGVIGPLLAYEVLTAFFLEASFLGVMLFGWKKVGEKLHFAATCLVAFGTTVSAFWILSANSWMQTPQGYQILADGRFVATSFAEVIFNPSFPSRLAHMLMAAFLTTALVVAAASAWRLLRQPAETESRYGLAMAVAMIVVVAPLQIFAGHISGEVSRHYQPMKLAAMEAYWHTGSDQPFHVIAIPDRQTQSNHMLIQIPGLGNFIQGAPRDEVILGLDQIPAEDQPPVWLVFWSFRVMAGLGVLFVLLGLAGAVLAWRGKLGNRLYLWSAVALGPTGFVAVIAGWIVAEVGRQPWIVYNVLRTADVVSPVAGGAVLASLVTYISLYALAFTAGVIFILRLVNEGPAAALDNTPPTDRAPGSAMAAAPSEIPGDPA